MHRLLHKPPNILCNILFKVRFLCLCNLCHLTCACQFSQVNFVTKTKIVHRTSHKVRRIKSGWSGMHVDRTNAWTFKVHSIRTHMLKVPTDQHTSVSRMFAIYVSSILAWHTSKFKSARRAVSDVSSGVHCFNKKNKQIRSIFKNSKKVRWNNGF